MLRVASSRERRLWIWMVAVVAGIYSTLALAQTLEGVFRAHGVLDVAFSAAAVLIVMTVVARTVAKRPGGAEIGVAIGVSVVYLLVILRAVLLEERSHLMEYGVVAGFIHEALPERQRNGRRVPAPGALAVVGAAHRRGRRVGAGRAALSRLRPADIIVNVVAALLAVGARAVLAVGRGLVTSKELTAPGNLRGSELERQGSGEPR